MKRLLSILTLFSMSFFLASCGQSDSGSGSGEPWSANQLTDPDAFAQKVKDRQTGESVILSIGYESLIPGSIEIGPGEESKSIERLQNYLSNISTDREVILYCGCCPMNVCPNIRPAFQKMKDMGFKNGKLLNLTTSIKADWLDKGYPVISQ